MVIPYNPQGGFGNTLMPQQGRPTMPGGPPQNTQYPSQPMPGTMQPNTQFQTNPGMQNPGGINPGTIMPGTMNPGVIQQQQPGTPLNSVLPSNPFPGMNQFQSQGNPGQFAHPMGSFAVNPGSGQGGAGMGFNGGDMSAWRQQRPTYTPGENMQDFRTSVQGWMQQRPNGWFGNSNNPQLPASPGQPPTGVSPMPPTSAPPGMQPQTTPPQGANRTFANPMAQQLFTMGGTRPTR